VNRSSTIPDKDKIMKMLPTSVSILRERGSKTGKIGDEIVLEEEMTTMTGMSAVVEDKMTLETMRTGIDDEGEMIDDDEMKILTEIIAERELIMKLVPKTDADAEKKITKRFADEPEQSMMRI